MTLHPFEFLTADDLPLPQEAPFTTSQAADLGVTPRMLRAWRELGLLVTPIRGVHHVAGLLDSLELRLACLRLVIPDDAVVCDRTAGWLHGAPMILAPGDHLAVPAASVFCRPGNRLRNAVSHSGERSFAADEREVMGGLLVTSPLRTACDLGRLLHRDQAFAALCMMARGCDLSAAELVDRAERYRGQRGVRQLRELSPDTEPQVQSPGEAIMLRRWLDCPDLPRPTPQVEVTGPDGPCYLDLAVPELEYAAEYDGEEWHDEEQRDHDQRRRGFIASHGRWEIDVLRKHNLQGPRQDAEIILRSGVRRALAARRTPRVLT